ncbi:MAG: hypothetical protein WBA87_14225 [Microbacterium sp.]
MMEYITGILALAFTAVFAISALTRGKLFAPTSRLELILRALDAATLLLFAHIMMPWAVLSPWLWLIPVALFAAGVAGINLKWSTLPFLRPDRSHRRTATWAIFHVIVIASLIVLVLG